MTRPSPGHAAASRLVLLAGLLIVMAVAALGFVAVTSFNYAVQPELDNRSRLIGTSIRNNIERALALGVPLDQMAGTEHYLLSVMASFPEVARITINTTSGITVTDVERHSDRAPGITPLPSPPVTLQDTTVSARESTFRFAVLAGNALAGEILIQVDHAFVEQQFTDVFLDVLVVVLVVLLLAFELTFAAVSTSLSKPLDGLYRMLEHQATGDFSHCLKLDKRGHITRAATRFSDHALDLNQRFAKLSKMLTSRAPMAAQAQGKLADIGSRYKLAAASPTAIELKDAVDIRLPLFLFATGEELSKSFLPQLVRSASTNTAWLSPEVLVSLPLIAYLLALILFSPAAGELVERYTARRVFLAALLPVGISHIGLSLSDNVGEFILWRGVAGAGYALATIACQEYALRTGPDGAHGRAMGGFVAVVIGGTFCGTAVGGVLADRLGTSNTFLFGAALVTMSALVALRMMSGDEGKRPETEQASPSAPCSPFANYRFVGLLFGIAIPANIMMAAFLWYIVPLALSDLGSRPADIGRVLMVYYLMTILVAPVAARFVDRSSGTPLLLAAGAAISGIALIGLWNWYGPWHIVGTVAAAGIGHAIIRATHVPLVIRVATTGAQRTTSAKALRALRMWERAGSVIGLATTGVLVGQYGYTTAIALIGFTTVAGTLFFVATEVVAARLTGG